MRSPSRANELCRTSGIKSCIQHAHTAFSIHSHVPQAYSSVEQITTTINICNVLCVRLCAVSVHYADSTAQLMSIMLCYITGVEATSSCDSIVCLGNVNDVNNKLINTHSVHITTLFTLHTQHKYILHTPHRHSTMFHYDSQHLS